MTAFGVLQAETLLRQFGLFDRWSAHTIAGVGECVVLVHRDRRHQPVAIGGASRHELAGRVERWCEMEARRGLTSRQESSDEDE